jgi:predicted DNA-binding protein (MmcQ/YjbR family)
MLEYVRDYCLSKKGVEESLPFDDDTPVYKVMGKIFALISLLHPQSINLKCDPERAIELREEYSGIIPGYHMNKVHWNTIAFDGSVPFKLVYELVDHSYDLIIKSLPKKTQIELKRRFDEE